MLKMKRLILAVRWRVDEAVGGKEEGDQFNKTEFKHLKADFKLYFSDFMSLNT